jgi:putative ABC transport system permease protein
LELLEIALADYGVDIQKAEELLRKYGAVENAYLSMFQALGSIGLVLGTFGVAATLIRSVWERRGEIGLLKALGFNNWNVQSLFLLEYAILLALGLGIGSGAALFSVIPLEQSSWDRWWMLLMIQLGMFLFGLMVCVISLWTIKSENILRSMRKE